MFEFITHNPVLNVTLLPDNILSCFFAFDNVSGFPKTLPFKSATSSDPITIESGLLDAIFLAFSIDRRFTYSATFSSLNFSSTLGDSDLKGI